MQHATCKMQNKVRSTKYWYWSIVHCPIVCCPCSFNVPCFPCSVFRVQLCIVHYAIMYWYMVHGTWYWHYLVLVRDISHFAFRVSPLLLSSPVSGLRSRSRVTARGLRRSRERLIRLTWSCLPHLFSFPSSLFSLYSLETAARLFSLC